MGEMTCVAEITFAKLEMTTWSGSPWSRPVHWRDAIWDHEGMEKSTGFIIETTSLGIVEFTRQTGSLESRGTGVIGIGRRIVLVSGG